jgi:hypothetical protein
MVPPEIIDKIQQRRRDNMLEWEKRIVAAQKKRDAIKPEDKKVIHCRPMSAVEREFIELYLKTGVPDDNTPYDITRWDKKSRQWVTKQVVEPAWAPKVTSNCGWTIKTQWQCDDSVIKGSCS